jgi:hypothetical protein
VTEPAAVPPDSRDWTFVITEGCTQCGFVPSPPERTGDRLRASIPIWRRALTSKTASERPTPTVWSPVEYGCHVSDTCQVFRHRLALMLAEDDPEFPNWDQDATAVEDRYFQQAPSQVAERLADQAEATASAFDAVQPHQWSRFGRRSNGSTFTVATFAVYFLHDIEHHLHDIDKGSCTT